MSRVIAAPEGGWTLRELACSVGMLSAPCPVLDRILDGFLRAGLRADHMVDAAFAGWAVRSTPRYTADAEAVRAMARVYGVVVVATPVRHGFQAQAMSSAGATERFHGAGEALASMAALLAVLDRDAG